MDPTEHSTLLDVFDREMRIEIDTPDGRKDVSPHLVRVMRKAPRINTICYARLDGMDADEVIRDQVAELSPLDQPFEWDLYDHDRPADLAERLAAQGFAPDPEPGAVMTLDLQHAPAELLAPVRADVRRITRPEELDDVIRIEESVWGGDFSWLRPQLEHSLSIPGYMSLYVAWADGQPACAAWIFYYRGSQFAGLYGGSTRAEFRGRGLYTATVATRAQEALQRGRRYLYINASPMSQPIVARHGFELLTKVSSMKWEQRD
ncbi:MAG TPA: GNAT family N-acetyltransferase [Anaerolineaceae bacterium]|nr:GNAT family N-acetyltransferase [Anaerolineaceae bacterium]